MGISSYEYKSITLGRLSFDLELNLTEISIGVVYEYNRYNIAYAGIKIPFLTLSVCWDMYPERKKPGFLLSVLSSGLKK